MSKKDSDYSRLFDAGCLVEQLIFTMILGGSYWWFIERKNIDLSQVISNTSVVSWFHEKFPNLPIPFLNSQEKSTELSSTKPSPAELTKNQPDSSKTKTPLPTPYSEKKDEELTPSQQQGMEVHAYFEKGIKIDENSPILDLTIRKKWIVPGVDKTYDKIEHYVLDVEMEEVANFFTNILVEFVKKYPNIDAVQWDDYLGYHAELLGKVDRTVNLTNFT
ncbi:family 10 glycosylhydrolase [Dapis sp. BLCC M229]|uniref:family 10 glycosylhydrolase n=1 Tax=Dapis sp. BLCC M229 TaxID=3400188 RepID=UPI003CE83A78